MLKLTQCLIVKNEENNLSTALSWGKNLFDEVIVVDTGSTDGTVDLAKKFGAKVFHFKWIDDFSAARNFAISRCSGDWIFFLDADEYFKDEDVPQLRPLVEKVNEQYVLVNDKKRWYNVIETPWVNLGSDTIARQARIFKNVPCLGYTGRLHERLHVVKEGYLKVYRIEDSPAIYHTGYMKTDEAKESAKGGRNFEVAKKALEEKPECAKLWLFAAEALMYDRKYKEAEQYFIEGMKNKDGSIWEERIREGYKQWLNIYMHMAAVESELPACLEAAIKVHSEAVVKFPDDPDFDFLISMLYFRAKDLKNTVRFFDVSLLKNDGKISKSLMASNGEKFEKLRELCTKLKLLNIV